MLLGTAGLESPVTCILHTLQPADVQSVLLLMAQHAPHTLEGLFMYALSPAAAEILTQKLEAASTESGTNKSV